MAKFCQEKFERLTAGDPNEVIVYWEQDKHVHDATFISAIARKLGEVHGGRWQVRKNSYQSHQSKPPENGTYLYGLFPKGIIE